MALYGGGIALGQLVFETKLAEAVGTGLTGLLPAAAAGVPLFAALAALTSFYGSITQKLLWKKWLLFLSALPLAVIGNVVRITSVGLISQAFGNNLAELAHDYNGYIVFAVALGLMLVIGNFLNTNLAELRERWRNALLNPTS